MANGYRMDAANLDGGFERIIEDFARGLGEDVRRATEKGAEVCCEVLQETKVPGDTGAYAAGWKVKADQASFFGAGAIVYNASKPGLTHLLEEGHQLFIHGKDTGRRAPAYPHISPAADAGMGAMEKELGR